jgi:hypothetical protein
LRYRAKHEQQMYYFDESINIYHHSHLLKPFLLS